MTDPTGIAGRLAGAFVHSKLTPLFIVASMLLGVYAVIALPREEEPQIIVPMIDVFVDMSGASPTEVEQRVTRPIEKLLWEVPGVEYLYSTSMPGRAMLVVRFLVGQDEERALVRLTQKLAANASLLPPGATAPLVQARSIDDVPVMALTLWGAGYDDLRLRQLAGQLQETLKELPDISEIAIIGGRPRQLSVDLDPAALAARGLDPLAVQQALSRGNIRTAARDIVAENRATRLESGEWPQSPDAVRNSVVGASGGAPVHLGDVADIRDGGGEPVDYVMQYPGRGQAFPAVTLSIAKRKGINAIALTRAVERKVETARGYLLPRDLNVSVTRNYGETAAQKSNELLWHMFLAVVSVSLLIWLILGRRESFVVLTAIPVTLALTLFVFYLYGYTLNRITLFALIFSIGILVDDAIVVVENIVRHARMSQDGRDLASIAVRAVDEVGNPTILATLAVIAAILPMAFVGGLMGPYMRPIPVGASAAMIFSLVVAFVVTPWTAVRLLRRPHAHVDEPEDRLTALYRRVMRPLLARPAARAGFLGLVAILLLGAVALVPLGLVTVKMLPFDNRNELQVIVHMPEDTPLEIFNTQQPFDSSKYAMKWDGEWHITYEVFRDLGIAFAAVLVLIYILVVGWFQSFVTPLTIMLAIPFSLVGILPAHALLGAFFTATSMIGFIAGAGIVVRNSIILVDFVELRVRDGMSIEDAVVDAGAVRFRPMALTAAAVIVGSAVILFDPIFQGLAISLMAGEVASLLLSRMTVPITYYLTHRRHAGIVVDHGVAA